VTAFGVPLGAIFVAALEFGGKSAPSWLDWFAGIGAIALVGVLFLGLPLAGLVASLWTTKER
jgi:hypothetical protein